MNPLDGAYAIAAALASPAWLRKARGGWGERLGRVGSLPAPTGRPRLLLHAVSVGEVNALRTLVPLLSAEADVVVASTTDTGIARARELFAPGAGVVRYPLDFSRSIARFLDAVRPDAVGLVELELWPGFLSACRRRGIPVGVINGRLSERSFRGYSRLRPALRGMFAGLSVAAVQDEAYAARFAWMGASRVEVTGSMKWDAADLAPVGEAAARLAVELGIDRSAPLIVAGSTGPREEELIRDACPAGVQLLCAPRKPERFDGAALALEPCVRRSRPDVRPAGATRFLLDSIGELRAAYALADLVIVGRSFFDQHGSDPIEPIALGRPAVIGPRVSDFATIVGAFESCGGIHRSTPAGLRDDLARLIRDGAGRRELGERGLRCVEANRGASARHARLLLGLAGLRRTTRRG